MDSLSEGLYDGASFEDIGKTLNIDYGKIGAPAIIGAYVYFTYGYDALTAAERDAIKGIYISDEWKGRFKLFTNGYISIHASGVLRELARKQVEKDFDAYLEEQGNNSFVPLIKYSLEIRHGRATSKFRQVLINCGFDVFGDLFRSTVGVLFCQDSEAEICILPNDQLMVVVGDEYESTAYLSNRHLTHASTELLHEAPILDDARGCYSQEFFSDLDTMKKAWNDHVRTLRIGT